MTLKYFKDSEVVGLNSELAIRLDQMREASGTPITITCGYRDPEHNIEVGGVPNSAHTRGFAADIECLNSEVRFKLIQAAFQVGFKRIEVATAHIHVDIDPTLPQNVLFLGISH